MKEYEFLIEIGTDELPPKILKKLGVDFYNYFKYEFKLNSIFYNSINWFAAPRHLAVKAKIFDKNHKNNCNMNNYDINLNDNYMSVDVNIQKNCIYKKNLKFLLLKIVSNVLKKLNRYEMMRWSNIQTSFVRPVHTVTILLDSGVIIDRFFEINTDRISYGHRYIKDNRIVINHASDYPDILMKKGCVIVDYNVRKKVIRTEVQKQALKLGGMIDIKDDSFLEKITASVEWPVVLFGRFNKRFLSLPLEIVIHIMKKHQGYFPVYNIIDGILLPCFIFVINTIADNYKKIITGHENTLTTRFMDAEFFLKNDSRYRLVDYIPKLNSILFHRQLGNLRDKVDRITELSGWIAQQINEDISQTKRASYLCKCDLMTDMVLEFPEVQGTIGMYYAQRDGESKEVAIAQKEHYQPQCIKDSIPTGKISCIVSIADKIDTISGIFGIEEIPTSSRDPFALKRAASGILKIIIQKNMPINLNHLIQQSITLYKSIFNYSNTIENNIKNFMYKRLYSYYFLQGYRSDIIKSILKIKYDYIIDYTSRIHAIHYFCTTNTVEYIKLHIIYKRISNILKKQNIFISNEKIQISLFKEPEEKKLFQKIIDINKKIKSLFLKKSYDIALIEIINLSDVINNFLDIIVVMDDNPNIQLNRLLLINSAKLLILEVIDLSVLRIDNTVN